MGNETVTINIIQHNQKMETIPQKKVNAKLIKSCSRCGKTHKLNQLPVYMQYAEIVVRRII